MKRRLESTLHQTAAEQTSSAVFALESPAGNPGRTNRVNSVVGFTFPRPCNLFLRENVAPGTWARPAFPGVRLGLNPVAWPPRSPLGSSLLHASLSSSGPGLRLFPAATQVRIPLGTPIQSIRKKHRMDLRAGECICPPRKPLRRSAHRGVTGVTDHAAFRRYSGIGFPEMRERATSKSPAEINRPIP